MTRSPRHLTTLGVLLTLAAPLHAQDTTTSNPAPPPPAPPRTRQNRHQPATPHQHRLANRPRRRQLLPRHHRRPLQTQIPHGPLRLPRPLLPHAQRCPAQLPLRQPDLPPPQCRSRRRRRHLRNHRRRRRPDRHGPRRLERKSQAPPASSTNPSPSAWAKNSTAQRPSSKPSTPA